MPRVLSQKALDMLADLPPYLQNDGMVQGVVAAQAGEYQRIESAATAILNGIFPAQANDVPILGVWTARLLSMWETLLNLPVNPAGVTLADRQAKVQAHIQARNSGAGSDWIATLSQAIGTSAWTHLEGPAAYTVTITLPGVSGTYSAGQVAQIARQITPAHLDVIVAFAGGFIVGVSLIGIQPL